MRIRTPLCTPSPSVAEAARARAWAQGACLLGFIVSGASAQTPVTDAGDPSASPWTPDVIQAIEPYAGPLGLDHFAGPNNADQMGRVTAALSNGDRVVVGLVPKYGGLNPANGLWNIGFVRYNPAGQRVAWPSPDDHGFFGGQYMVHPNLDQPSYLYLRDVQVRNGWIYVLADVQQQTQVGLGRQDVRILQMREDGSAFTEWPVFGYPAANGPDQEDFYGAQMAFVSNNRMIVGATAWDDIGPYPVATRLEVLGNGAVSLDNGWGSPYGGSGSFNRIIRYYPPASYCAAGTQCNATVGYTVNQVGFATQDDFYLGGSRQWDGDNWDAFALKISSLDGSTKLEFSDDGWSSVQFDQPDSPFTDSSDYGRGLYVYQDDVYLAAEVDRGCHPGFGLAKLNGATGEYVTGFGSGGVVVYGGVSYDDPGCGNLGDDDIPFAMSATGGRLGIVGYSHWTDQGGTEFYDPRLTVINAVDGSLIHSARHPVKRPDGSRLGDAVLYSVYGGPSPDSPFTVAGDGRDASAGNTLSFLSGRLGLDSIFANGFD